MASYCSSSLRVVSKFVAFLISSTCLRCFASNMRRFVSGDVSACHSSPCHVAGASMQSKRARTFRRADLPEHDPDKLVKKNNPVKREKLGHVHAFLQRSQNV